MRESQNPQASELRFRARLTNAALDLELAPV